MAQNAIALRQYCLTLSIGLYAYLFSYWFFQNDPLNVSNILTAPNHAENMKCLAEMSQKFYLIIS